MCERALATGKELGEVVGQVPIFTEDRIRSWTGRPLTEHGEGAQERPRRPSTTGGDRVTAP
jgi:hypothetical protein